MKHSKLFQNLEKAAFQAGINPKTKESREWFRKRISDMRGKELRRINRNQLMKSDELDLKTQQIVGSMFMFFYQPKHRETLPYYDSFPLVIVVGPAEGGFYGLNLHYLPPVLRAKFLDGLMDRTNNKKFDESTRFEVTYDYLKSASEMKYFQPCFKHYLGSHVKSKFAMVPPKEWEIATFLPTADWQKKSGQYVYKQSRGMI